MIVPGSAHPFLMAGATDPLDNLGVIARALRFRPAASASLNRTFGAPTNNKIFTLFGWVKRADLNGDYRFFGATDGSTNSYFGFGNGGSGDSLVLTFDSVTVANGELTYPPAYRDPGDHMFVVIGIDTTQATAANRVTVEVNGVALPAPSGAYPAQNSTPILNGARKHFIGAQSDTGGNAASFFSGLWSFFGMVDGTKLSASSFGVIHPFTKQWRTYSKAAIKTVIDAGGANSFFLPFDDPTNTTTLCADASSKGNNFTATNVSLSAGGTYDSVLDTPTNNFCVANSVAPGVSGISGGGMVLTPPGVGYQSFPTTMPISSGKIYAELVLPNIANVTEFGFTTNASGLPNNSVTTRFGNAADSWSLSASSDGSLWTEHNGSNTSVAAAGTVTTGDTLRLAINANTGDVWVGYKTSWIGGGDPAAGTSPTFTGFARTRLFMGVTLGSGSGLAYLNCGQQPIVATTPSGFKTNSTKNLPFPPVPGAASGYVAVTAGGANIASTLAAARAGWSAYIDIIKCTSATEGWRWIFSDDSGNYLDSSSTAAKAAVPAFSGTSYNGYSLKVSATNGVATGRLVHTNGVADTVTDGLGNTRKAVILKNEATGVWYFYHPDLTAGKLLYLEQTSGETTDATLSAVLANSFTVAAALASGTYRWFALSEISGFLRLVKNTGNGSANGTFENEDQSPAFLFSKRIDSTDDYTLYSNIQQTYNITPNSYLGLNRNYAYGVMSSGYNRDLLSNGFKNRDTPISGTYVHVSIGQPFRYANAR